MTEQTTYSEPPTWLCELVKQLKERGEPLRVEEARAMLAMVQIDPNQVVQSNRFDPRFYTRTSVLRTETVEVLIMGWLPGQMSPLHNHRGSICAVKVVAGGAIEVGYERTLSKLLAPRVISHFHEGSVTASQDEEIHQLGNCRDVPLVTLHIYSPPLSSAEVFPEAESILSSESFESMVSVASIDLSSDTASASSPQ